MRRIQTIEDVEKRLFVVHGRLISLVRESYVKMNALCTFLDVDFGEFEALPSNVINKRSGHPKRGSMNRKHTNLIRYGTSCVLNAEFSKQKIRDRYGVTNVFQSEEIKQKIVERNIEKYGVANALQRIDVKNKIAQTNMIRYGVPCTLSDPTTRNKIRLTNVAKYGFENPMMNRDVMIKAIRTNRKLSLINHWKSGEELVCSASYEKAFVLWCNHHLIDFDWQIPHLMPNGKTYVVDAFIKTGQFANTWIEIKGTFARKGGHVGLNKWLWFNGLYPNSSQLWNLSVLKQVGVLTAKGAPKYDHETLGS